MHDEIVKYPTAKLAKEKGFDLITYGSYYEENTDVEYYKDIIIPLNRSPFWTSAPTQSLLQKWLREVKNVIITPPLYFKNRGYACAIIAEKDTIFYKTYEYALEDELYKQLTKL